MSYISEQELRNLINEGKTLYQISRHFNTKIPEIFKLGRSYGISFAYDHNHIPYPNKQDLESMYIDECMSQREIGREFDVTDMPVGKWFRKYGIPTRGPNGTLAVPMPSKEVLERMYFEYDMTQYQISREFNVDQSAVWNWFRKHNIQARVPIPPKEVLEKMYLEDGMTQEQISIEFGVTRRAVGAWIYNYNIPTKVPMPPKDDLINCIDNGLNQLQIAEKYDVSEWKIYEWCNYYGIPGMVSSFRCMTPEHHDWRYAVLERDNYICQECGGVGDVLHAHHIKPYHDYPELEFDIDNGITLCKRCHNNIRGREYQYIVKYEDIVLRDRCIGDYY